MTRAEALKTALESKREMLLKKQNDREKKITEFTKQNEAFARVNASISALGARLALTAISGDSEKLDKIKAEMDSLSKEKERLIKESKIAELEYECSACGDTGYVDGALCECVKRAAGEMMLEELSEISPSKNCRFDNFKLSYYEGEDAKKRMTAVFELAKKYAEEFSCQNSKNLLFLGNTGLGKTHLSLAIANEVIKKGYDVLYSPAYNLFAKIETEHFSLHTNETYENAVSCDLLIIDDLGGEFVSPYIQSVVYNVINTRLITARPTIINSNLQFNKIQDLYSPRVASRLAGEYVMKNFLGNDIRLIKAVEGE